MKASALSLARTTISIDKTTLDRFFHAYPAGTRSNIIQRLIEKDLDTQLDQLARAAELVESHPDFQNVREDSAYWERATVHDGLHNI